MNDSLTIAILAGLGGMLGWGFADFSAKKTIGHIGDVASLVWAHCIGTAIFILAALYQFAVTGNALQIPSGFKVWTLLVFFGVLQMIVYWLVYKGFSKGQLALLSPIFASYSGLVALMSIAFFGEKLSAGLVVAIVAIFIGIILINSDFESLRRRRLKLTLGVGEVSLAAILASIWTMGWGKFVENQNYLAYALFMYLFMTVAAYILAKSLRTKLGGVKPDVWKFLFLIGLGEAVAYLAISMGFSKTSHISVVALISGSFSLPAIVLAYFFLKERISRLQVLAILIILVGIGLISTA